MDFKTIMLSIDQIADEKGIAKEKVIEVMEQALAAAYKKEYGEKGQHIKAKIDQKTGSVEFWQLKDVVDESMIYSEAELEELKQKKTEPEMEQAVGEEAKPEKVRFNPERHIMIEEAKKTTPEVKVGDIFKISLKTEDIFGRIATQTAKQVILQKLREAERAAILLEYSAKEGEIISGIVQRVEEGGIFLDIGKALGFLPRSEQVQGEFYRSGQRLKLFVLKVEQDPKGPRVLLSRAYPKLISKLFELEVPEIAAGQIEIKSIAREQGSRSKIAVWTEEENLDPVGSCIGQRGSRVGAVIAELGGEKIDIIEYSESPEIFIKNALSPAKILEVKIMPKNKAFAMVPQDQLSLAIGRDGQNVRLAAKLTGWKIDVKSYEEGVQLEEIEEQEEMPEQEMEKLPAAETQAVTEEKSGEEEKEIKEEAPKEKADEEKPKKRGRKKKAEIKEEKAKVPEEKTESKNK